MNLSISLDSGVSIFSDCSSSFITFENEVSEYFLSTLTVSIPSILTVPA